MTLRRISIENSVKHIPQTERVSKPNTTRMISNCRKQNENISQNNKKFIKNLAAQGFGNLNQ